MTALVEIRDLVIQRGGRDALQIGALDIPRGETLAIVGPNGSGKSTLLLALARLIKPGSGQINFNGDPISKLNELEYRRKISFVFQDPLLLDMLVEENVALGLRFRGLTKDEAGLRVHQWMKQLGIGSLAKRRADQISGGEAQRISLARAFVLEPELLLLDEPFSALDAITRRGLREELRNLKSKMLFPIIYVTHDITEALYLADELLPVVEGKIDDQWMQRMITREPSSEVALRAAREPRLSLVY